MTGKTEDILPKGAILQRDKKTYAITPRIPGGILSPEILERIAKVVRKYNLDAVKITSGNRIALVGIKKEDVESVWNDLDMDIGHSTGLCFHYVQTCPGIDFCKYGIQDSIGLGTKLEKILYGRKFPAKVKVGVSGCNMCCANSFIKDIGIVGKRLGWTVVVGGRAGTLPKGGQVLAKNLTDEEAIDIVKKFLDYYADNAKDDVRIFRLVDRVGIDKIKETVID